MLKIDSGASESLVEPSERFMPESSLTISRDKVDLARAVRSELCSTDRQSKNYRPWFLVVKETME